MFVQGCLQRGPEGAQKATGQCAPQQAGLEPLTGTSAEEVGRSQACRGVNIHRQGC